MKYVLDSSVGAKWVLTEVDSNKARRLRDDYRQGHHQLIAPDWFLLEVMNILGKAAARKTITPAEAVQGLSLILQDAPVYHPSLALAASAFQLALQHHRAVYDLLYLALALQEHCELVTADDALVHQLQPIYGCLVALSTLP
jgi:predicted nucleic acid-binding protein